MVTRREFLAGSAAVAGSALLGQGAFAFTQDSPSLKVGLIGAGARGCGAVRDCVAAAPGVVLWAIGDVFLDHLLAAKNSLREGLQDAYRVTEDRLFQGFDAYRGVVDSGVDLVVLTAPPGFRPAHLAYAVEKGKHVFMEKPVAVDGPGVRSVLASHDVAQAKGLCVVAGTQRRHDAAYLACIERIREGALGEITAMYAYWTQGGLWMHPRAERWSDMEWQLRNWLYFTWLSGDIICEQHIHNIDVCNWAFGGHPVKALSLAGREVRKDPAYGHVFDHFATEYEYPGGVKMVSLCRQIDGTASRVGEWIVGTKGTSNAQTSIKGERPWRFDGERPNPYVQEHKNLVQAVRSGKPVNETRQVAESTLTAIMGRTAGYTGQEVTWDQALSDDTDMTPPKLEFGPLPTPPVPVPGSPVKPGAYWGG
jgi:predicted dehydrogenase